jgi:hypothetical protein
MSSRNVRRGIGQAAWNKQFDDWYTCHVMLIPVLLGVVFQSWWVFLVTVIGIPILMNMSVWFRRIVLGLFSLLWTCFAGLIGAGMLSSDAGRVFGILGFCIAYVNLGSGWQYWYDLG